MDAEEVFNFSIRGSIEWKINIPSKETKNHVEFCFVVKMILNNIHFGANLFSFVSFFFLYLIKL